MGQQGIFLLLGCIQALQQGPDAADALKATNLSAPIQI
jgi:hypothetical protein